MVWLNPKSRFKLILELIPSRGPKMINFVSWASQSERWLLPKRPAIADTSITTDFWHVQVRFVHVGALIWSWCRTHTINPSSNSLSSRQYILPRSRRVVLFHLKLHLSSCQTFRNPCATSATPCAENVTCKGIVWWLGSSRHDKSNRCLTGHATSFWPTRPTCCLRRGGPRPSSCSACSFCSKHMTSSSRCNFRNHTGALDRHPWVKLIPKINSRRQPRY